eukprot:10306414-Karenia_brevis.AAC.1
MVQTRSLVQPRQQHLLACTAHSKFCLWSPTSCRGELKPCCALVTKAFSVGHSCAMSGKHNLWKTSKGCTLRKVLDGLGSKVCNQLP